MKIGERVALIRAGYTKDEIAAMVEEEKAMLAAPAQQEQTEPAPDEDPNKPELPTEFFPEWAKALIEKVDGLETAAKSNALKSITQPDEVTAERAGDDALRQYLGVTN